MFTIGSVQEDQDKVDILRRVFVVYDTIAI